MTPADEDRRADALRNREAVLEAGLAILSSDPTQSMQEIADASGLGRTTVYRHFSDREELLDAVLDKVIRETWVKTGAVPVDNRDPEEVIRDFAAIVLDTCFLYGPLIAHRSANSEAIEASRDTTESPIRAYLEDSAERGLIRSDMPVRWLLTVVQAVPMQALDEVRDGQLTKAEAHPLVADTLVSILLQD